MIHFGAIALTVGIVLYAVACTLLVLRAAAAREAAWRSFERVARRYCAKRNAKG